MQMAETGLEFFKQAIFLKDDSEPLMQQLFPKFLREKVNWKLG